MLGWTPLSRFAAGVGCVMGRGQGGRMGWAIGTGLPVGPGGSRSTAMQSRGHGFGGGGLLGRTPWSTVAADFGCWTGRGQGGRMGWGVGTGLQVGSGVSRSTAMQSCGYGFGGGGLLGRTPWSRVAADFGC